MQITDEMVEAAARSDAEFDKRGWLEMPKHERERYLARGRKSLTAALTKAWRPIEEAPRDGTEIWAFNGEQNRMIWISGDGYALWVYSEEILADADPDPEQPTHWMPLPAPPATPEASE